MLKNDSILIKLSDISESCFLKLVMVQDNGKKENVIYEGAEVAVAKGELALIDFDVSDFKDDMGKGDIEMRIYARGANGLPCEITVSAILAGKEKTNTALIVVLIVLASTAAVAIIVLGVIWFRKNYEIQFDRLKKKAKKDGKKKESKKSDGKASDDDKDVKVK